MRPLFQLDARLALCASFVPQGARLADIGTDHGYLPIWLAKQNRIVHAIGADLRPGPLRRAKENVLKYRVEDMVELRLSDGLKAIAPSEADIIVIAGMGGEVIASIIEDACWLKEQKTPLILQPMTSAEKLRKRLWETGFEIVSEKPVISQNRPYSVLSAVYSGKQPEQEELFFYTGRLTQEVYADDRERQAALCYLQGQLRRLKNLETGAHARGREQDRERYGSAAKQLEQIVRKEFSK